MFSAAMAGFQEGLERQSALRAEFTFEDMPPPKRLAPHATATAATMSREGADVAWGRLVLLYDPEGPEGWHGCYRLISYLRAEIDPEIAADPMLGQVGWSWLIEALDACTPGYAAPSGTVTRVTTEGFGGKADEEPVHGYEQRASWSPAPAGVDLAAAGRSRRPRRSGNAGHRRARDRLVRFTGRRGWAAAAGDRHAAAAAARPDGGAEPAAPVTAESQPARDVGQVVPLLEPRDGLPPVVETAEELVRVTRAMAEGIGPVAVDAERASGYRYGHRAYLVQFRREGAGTALIDPITCPDLSGLDAALAGTEAVLHAASQDLPCLSELNYRPRILFDTELAGRLLGFPRVALGTLVETVLGLHLEKGHSAADWSTRPLPADWLRYAALDVEVLTELRDALADMLVEQGKMDWARQEFAAVLSAAPPAPRPDPWRRTSGIHRVRSRRSLAVVRELWEQRDKIAQDMNLSPGRVLPDAAIVEAARALPTSNTTLTRIPGFTSRVARRHLAEWLGAIRRARALPESALPDTGGATAASGPPPTHRWAERDPGRRGAARGHPRHRGRPGRGAHHARGEPAPAGRGTPDQLGATGPARPARGRGGAGPVRRPSLAA